MMYLSFKKTLFVSLKFESNWIAYAIISKSGNFN